MKKRILSLFTAITIVCTFLGYCPGFGMIASAADVSSMAPVDSTYEFIMSLEGFSSGCFWDYAQWSIGYGNKCPYSHSSNGTYAGQKGGHTISQSYAKQLLIEKLPSYVSTLKSNCKGLSMNQNQFDALLSATYNHGNVNSCPLKYYLQGTLSQSEARSQYYEWCINKGTSSEQGLRNRRKKEADRFFSGSNPILPGIVDSSYGTNRSYTATKRIYTYDEYGTLEGNRYIDPNDKCTIVEVYTNGFLKVIYPTSSGNRTAYGKTSDFNGFGPLAEDKGGVTIHAWLSDTPMGNVPSRFETGGNLYLCYELKYSKSGQRIGNFDGKSYKVTETIKNPDGSKNFDYTYDNSDNNWIRITPSKEGTYSGVISVSGSITGSTTVSTKVYLKPVPAVRNFVSDTSNGSKAETVVTNKQYYLRYEFIDNNTKELMSKSTSQYSDATFKAEIYDNNKNKIASKDFGKSESGYLAFTPKTTGTYTYKIYYSMSAGSGNVEKTFTVTNCTHSYGSWKTTKSATCTAAGSKERTCTVCGNVEKQTIAQTGHSYGSWTTKTAATCTATGIETRTCSYCGSVEQRTVAKKAHNYTTKVVQPTTTAEGYTFHTCTACGDSYKDNYVEKLKPVDPNAAQIVVDTSTTSAGGTVTVGVSLKNNPGISGMLLKLNYDSSVLTLQSAEAKNLDVTFSEKTTANPYSILWYDGLKNVKTNGTIAEFTFKVSDKAKEGTYPITITYGADDISDVYDKNVHFEVVNGGVVVSSHIAGDVNGDGKANVKDLIRLQQYLNGWNVAVVSSDINGDGKTNVKDLIRLQQYLNGWNVAVY